MDGYLLIDKPTGWTSHDVVAKLRAKLNPVWRQREASGRKLRVGHAGTLDPMATGLLIILVGRATKQQDSFMKLDKSYRARVRLGSYSSTDDGEGDITAASGKTEVVRLSKSEIDTALNRFRGEIEQLPPQHSAIKVEGRRAYKSARAGEKVELKPRQVTVHSLEITDLDLPEVGLNCHVGSGTYIRSLARDLGEELGVGGYLSGLRRLSVGEWSVDEALSPQTETDKLLEHIQTVDA